MEGGASHRSPLGHYTRINLIEHCFRPVFESPIRPEVGKNWATHPTTAFASCPMDGLTESRPCSKARTRDWPAPNDGHTWRHV